MLFQNEFFFTNSQTLLYFRNIWSSIRIFIPYFPLSDFFFAHTHFKFITIFISYNFILKQILGLNLNLFDRFELSNVKEASGRLDIIDAAMALGFDTLFMGVGIGQYKFYHLDYISSSAYNTLTEFDLTTHNHMLDLLVNYGFISFFIFLFAFYKVFIFYFRNQHIYFFKFALFTVFILLISSLSQEMFTFPLYWMFLSLLTIPIYNNFFYD